MFGFGKTPAPDDPLDAELKRLEERKKRMREELSAIEESLQINHEKESKPKQDKATFVTAHSTSPMAAPTLLGVEKKRFRNRAIVLGAIIILLLILVIRVLF